MIETVPGRYGKISFFSSDLVIGRSLRTYGEWAENEIRFLLRSVHPGDTVLDVGANIGTHTLAFARAVGVSGKVWAFEPRPEIFRVLDANILETVDLDFGPRCALAWCMNTSASGHRSARRLL